MPKREQQSELTSPLHDFVYNFPLSESSIVDVFSLDLPAPKLPDLGNVIYKSPV